jgi:hypothetical protein
MIDVVYSGVVRLLCFCPKVPLMAPQTVTIFAYGVTSSGKTHTMQGTPEEPGVIPRVVKVGTRCLRRTNAWLSTTKQAMFDRRGELGLADASLTMSYIEIYKDEVYDLLGNRAEVSCADFVVMSIL